MRLLTSPSRLAFVGTQIVSRRSPEAAFVLPPPFLMSASGNGGSGGGGGVSSVGVSFSSHSAPRTSPFLLSTTTSWSTMSSISSSSSSSSTRLFSSSMSGGGGGGQQDGTVNLQNVGLEEMEEIVEDYEQDGREESGYVIIDVREPHEIAMTGKVSPHTYNVPLGVIANNVFGLDAEEFQEVAGFEKPSPDETIVFSCAAGIRSVHACNFVAQAGYSKLVNYKGGANEWFPSRF